MEPEFRILASGTMRTGGSLLSNFMCAHSKMFVFGERFHFFRFCNERYNPLTEKSVRRLLEHQALRLRYRFEIDFDVDQVFTNVCERELSYAVIFDEGMKYFLNKVGRTIWGEYVAMQWRDIPTFINMYDNSRAIHIYRDPRSVLSSWKSLSFAHDGLYLNTIFNWIDSMNHIEKYKRELSSDRYLPLCYEEIMAEPKSHVHKICDFIGVNFEEEMLIPETWHGRLPQEFLINPRSAHQGKNIRGFSTSRTKNWINNLEEWEIAIIEYLCHDQMKQYGYEFYKTGYSVTNIKHGLNTLGRQPLMMQRLNHLLSTGEGSPLYYNDPADPKNWAAAKRDISAKFTDAEADDANDYFKRLDEIEAELTKQYGN
jgi:hypothetical protein